MTPNYIKIIVEEQRPEQAIDLPSQALLKVGIYHEVTWSKSS